MTTSILNIRGLCFAVGAAALLDDIHMQVGPGEIMAIVGPNGAGKTTLLKAVCGDIVPTQGEIQLNGIAIDAWPRQQRARHVAVLPQLSVLNFPYTVEEVVGLGRIPHSSGARIDQGIIAEAMRAMDISYLQGRLYTKLSGGEKQRTQLARVMAQIWRKDDAAQRLLLLDEPTTALDLGHQQQLMGAIVDFAKQGVAVVMVVHDINIAARYADSVTAISCGRSLAQGAVDDVMTETMLKNLFNADIRMVEDPLTKRRVVIS